MTSRRFLFSQDYLSPPPGARPFPSGRTKPYLLNCRKCTLKKVPYWNIPDKAAYHSKCFGCGTIHGFRRGTQQWEELLQKNDLRLGVKRTHDGRLVDARQRLEILDELRSLGTRRAHRAGLAIAGDPK